MLSDRSSDFYCTLYIIHCTLYILLLEHYYLLHLTIRSAFSNDIFYGNLSKLYQTRSGAGGFNNSKLAQHKCIRHPELFARDLVTWGPQ